MQSKLSPSSNTQDRFQAPSDSHSKIRESNKLRLRKERLNDYLINRHLNEIKSNIINNSNYEIKIENLQLTSTFMSEFNASNSKLSFAISNLASNSLDIKKFSLLQLHQHFKNFTNDKDNIDRLIFPSTLNEMINILLTHSANNNEIVYEITWLFILFSINSKSIIFHIANEQVVKVLFEILTQKDLDYSLMNNVLLLFGNWLTEPKVFQLITNTCNISGFIFQSIQIFEKCKVPLEFIANCLWILGNLINDYSFPLIKGYLEKSLKHIVKYIISDLNRNLFVIALNTLSRIFTYAQIGDFSSEEIEELDFARTIIQYITPEANEKDVLEKALDILINLTYINDFYITELVFDNDLIPRIQRLLEDMLQNPSKSKSVLSQITDLINNLVSLTKTMEYLIRKTLIISYLTDILQMDLTKEVYLSIMNILHSIVNSNSKRLYMEVLYLEIPKKVLLPTLNLNKDEESKLISLSIAGTLLEFGENLIKGQNFIQRHFEKIGLCTLIESFTDCNSKDISEKAVQINNKFLSYH